MCTVQAFMVHRAVQCADFVPPAFACHTEDLGETLANNHCFVIQPLCTWKLCLALGCIVWSHAAQQRYTLAFLVYGVHVMLLQLLQCLHIVGEVLIQPPPGFVATLASSFRSVLRRTCNTGVMSAKLI